VEKALADEISVVYMDFNLHLFTTQAETQNLVHLIDDLLTKHGFKESRVYLGGMSMGGNVALILANYVEKNNLDINLDGVFIVDSPIDLHKLYTKALNDLQRVDLPQAQLEEPRWILNYFENKFSGSTEVIANDALRVSPFSMKKPDGNNIQHLSSLKLRFYTEPDSAWWERERNTKIEDTNAHVFQVASAYFEDQGWDKFELIQTSGKGYRANGDRHPHSWSIVDPSVLIEWILDEN
jgi:pimeloyl-ACP methyl ester carboxylesterase